MPQRLSSFLVRRRVPLLILMTVLAGVCVLLIPHVRINGDLTSYLPDDSSMKHGLDIVAANAPDLDARIRSMSSAFGDESDLLPKELPLAIGLGVTLIVLVLLVMSPSLAELPLILLAVGYSVLFNMGTNALLPSLSATTNSIAGVLQMVLSIDYSIILVNRYRQERGRGLPPPEAMETAINLASSAIVSSAFTTLASLLMLCFIKLKMGADLGVVLGKGVVFSLICNFTVLPALVIWADRLLESTRKKVPVVPAAALARFEYRFRVPLTIFFILAFAGSYLLQRRTPICYSSDWEIEAAVQKVDDANPLMLIFRTDEEAAIPALLDSLAADPAVTMTASYPSILGRRCTAAEMREMMAQAGGEELPLELMRMIYYARAHPDRSAERLSVDEVEATAQQLADLGYIQEGSFDRAALMRRLMPPAATQPVHRHPVQPPLQTTPAADTSSVAADSLALAADSLQTQAAPADTVAAQPASGFSYAQATTALGAAAMAEFFEMDRMPVNTVYRMAGRARGRMTPQEFIAYVRDHILTRRRYAVLLPNGLEEQLLKVGRQLDSAVAAGPDTLLVARVLADSLAHRAADSLSVADSLAPPPLVAEPQEPEPEIVVTPGERLAEMALSGRKYPASTVQKALSAAGVEVSPTEMDLLYLYAFSRSAYDEHWTATPVEMLDFVADTLLADPAFDHLVDAPVRQALDSTRAELRSQGGLLRGEQYSAALVMTSLEIESERTFDFMDKAARAADGALSGEHYWIGESMMYKELKDGFPRELLLLTVLTVLAIFLIVALTFRSLLVPFPLVLCIMSGVYIAVFACGLGGRSLNYVAYLVVQGILMGATIDYAILLTSYFRTALRSGGDKVSALEAAYRGASHSILTSGLILSLVPFAMLLVLRDPMMVMILRSLGIGAAAVLLLILFVLPGVLAATFRGQRKQ